jgi:hypothetical protein
MKQLGKLGLGSRIGAKDKRAALAGLSDTGAMVDPGAGGGGGLLGGLGSGLGGLFGGGGGMPDLGGMDPSALMGGTNPMGSSATRKSGRADDKRRKEKAKAKQRRKNRRKK